MWFLLFWIHSVVWDGGGEGGATKQNYSQQEKGFRNHPGSSFETPIIGWKAHLEDQSYGMSKYSVDLSIVMTYACNVVLIQFVTSLLIHVSLIQ